VVGPRANLGKARDVRNEGVRNLSEKEASVFEGAPETLLGGTKMGNVRWEKQVAKSRKMKSYWGEKGKIPVEARGGP